MGKHRGKKKITTSYVDGIAIRQLRPDYFQVDYQVAGKRARVGYATLKEAETHCHLKAAELKNHGLSALDFPDAMRIDAMRAIGFLKGTGASLTTAAKEYAGRHPATEGESFRTTCDKYLARMAVDGCRPLSIKDKKIKFAVICRDLGNRATVSIDRLDVEKWTAEKGYTRGTAQVYAKNIDTVQRFFGGHKRIRRHIDERIPQTWTPAEVTILFKTAEKKQPAILPALTALFFAGVRPHEMMRLTWDAVDCEARVLRLGAAVTKTRTMRNVELSDNAVVWFKAHRSTGLLVPSEAQYRTMREEVMKAANLKKWPVDIARHTFATATYQSTGDAGKTMKQLGHFGNPDIFARHYKGQPWSAEDAAAYWQIKPNKKAATTVIAFAAAG